MKDRFLHPVGLRAWVASARRALQLALLTLACVAVGPSQDLQIIHTANAGMLLDCGGRRVAIDVFFRDGVAGYETLQADTREALETARPPYDGIELILATHRHADHFDAASVARHLQSNPRARFAGTAQTASQVRRLMAERVEEIQPPAQRSWAGIEASFLKVPHNHPHRDTIENTLHLVRWCGVTVAVTGDAEVAVEDFQGLRLEEQQIDVLVAPWWFFVSPAGRQVVDEIIRPQTVWAVHGDLNNPSEWTAQVKSHYPNAQMGFADAPTAPEQHP